MKKGFTLIELLAVIVILAIIALIATPIILNIINDSKKSADERSVDLYGKAVEQAAARYQLLNNRMPSTFSDLETGNYIEYDGSRVECETKMINSDGTVYLSGCSVGGSSNTYSYGKESGFTGIIYRNTTDSIWLGQSIVPDTKDGWCGSGTVDGQQINSCYMGLIFDTESDCENMINRFETTDGTCTLGSGTIGLSNGYKTELTKNEIEQDIYLKHNVVNDIVTASYACIKYTEGGVQKEACLRGVDETYYGTFTGTYPNIMSATGNISSILSTKDYFTSNSGTCYFSENYSYCGNSSDFRSSTFGLYAANNGYVDLGNPSTGSGCQVSDLGYSTCGIKN